MQGGQTRYFKNRKIKFSQICDLPESLKTFEILSVVFLLSFYKYYDTHLPLFKNERKVSGRADKTFDVYIIESNIGFHVKLS